MRVYAIQWDLAWEDKPANFAKAQALIAAAAPEPKSLVVLPEMFGTGFSMSVGAVVEGEARETESFLAETAQRHGIYIVGGVTAYDKEGHARNQSVAYNPQGEEVSRYNKMFPFRLGGEAEAYPAGDRLVLWDWEGVKVAMFVCYDLRFPEIFRKAVTQGAQLYTVIASWPNRRTHHWTTLLEARAIENQAYIVGVNRTGTDPSLEYPGRSRIVSPHGFVLEDAGANEGVISAELDIADLCEYRERFSILQDIRPEWMGGNR